MKNKLILMCGASASGKTTFSKNLEIQNPTYIRLSSDELRAIIGTDESDQSVSGIVFKTLQTMVEFFLKSDRTVILDATNYHKQARANFINIAKVLGAPIDAYVFEVDLDELKRRNAARERKVPEYVIENQFKRFQPPDALEGCSVFYATTR